MKKIIDESVCKSNGLRLFGCVNNEGYYYPVKDKSTYKISGDMEKDFEYCILNTEAKNYNCAIKIELDEEKKENNIKPEVKNTNNKNNEMKDKNNEMKDKNEVEGLLEIIQNKNKEYKDWIKVGMSLHTMDKGEKMKEIWYDWSKKDYIWKANRYS